MELQWLDSDKWDSFAHATEGCRKLAERVMIEVYNCETFEEHKKVHGGEGWTEDEMWRSYIEDVDDQDCILEMYQMLAKEKYPDAPTVVTVDYHEVGEGYFDAAIYAVVPESKADVIAIVAAYLKELNSAPELAELVADKLLDRASSGKKLP